MDFIELCKIEVRHILFKKIRFLVFFNNQIIACFTRIYCLKRKNKKANFFFSNYA